MSEVARSRRDGPSYEPQMAVSRRDPPLGQADPLAELARLVGQDDPYRNVFRPAAAPAPGAGRDVHDAHAAYPEDEVAHGGATAHEPYHDDGQGYDDQLYADQLYDEAHRQGVDHAYDGAHEGDGHDAYGHPYDAADQVAHGYDTDEAAAATLPDMWARGGDGVAADGSALDQGVTRPMTSGDDRPSARRPLLVLAAVLVLTGGGLAASFLARSPSTPGVAVARSGGSAPTIMAPGGPTKVKMEDAGATAPEDQDAALLNKNGSMSSGPVKIVSSQEQPVDLGQLPKTSDLADGARPLPPASPSPFPQPKKVKTFVVHPDGSMLSSDGAPAAGDGAGPQASAALNPAGSALPATPRTASRGGTTPQSAPPADALAALAVAPTDTGSIPAATPSKPARQPAAPGVKTASLKPNDTADAPAAAAATGGGYGVQLASSPVEADATAAFAKLKKKYPAQLGSLTATVHKAETGDKPVYRVRVGSMTQEEAKALCSQIQGAGGSCFVVHN